jgi:HSP20 family protein
MNLLKRRSKQREDGRGDGSSTLATRQRGGSDMVFDRFRSEMDRVFDRVWRDIDSGDPWSALSRLPNAFGNLTDWPAIDMAEDDKAILLRIDVPGLEPKDIDVELSGNVLTLRGQRSDEWSDNAKGVYRRERRSGSFRRTIPLPDYVEPDKIEARYDKGTLTLTVPKAPGKGPKRVQVKA